MYVKNRERERESAREIKIIKQERLGKKHKIKKLETKREEKYRCFGMIIVCIYIVCQEGRNLKVNLHPNSESLFSRGFVSRGSGKERKK